MHLAAATGLPCVAIFSAHNKPGPWYPYGVGNRVIYHQVPCFDCGLEKCIRYAKRCIASITIDEVLQAATEQFGRAAERRNTAHRAEAT
jgi:lipopolysaccharide heptosyltransferase III